MDTLITYYIANDSGDKLKQTAKAACNFWNRFVLPDMNIVVRLGLFTENSGTIARSWMPWEKDNTKYGRIEFNTKYLGDFTSDDITGVIIHEIGHTLGFGFEKWDILYDHDTGNFLDEYIRQLPELQPMIVELDGGPGTAGAHWDEKKFGRELMTGYDDPVESVLPVTIKVMNLLGNAVKEELLVETELPILINEVAGIMFDRKERAQALDLKHFVETAVWEDIPFKK